MSEIKDHTILEQSIIKTLVYYEIFHYPLKSTEVFKFLRSNSVSETDVVKCLNHLAERNHLSRFGEFYTLQKNESDIKRRVKGNVEAERWWPVAKRQAKLISKFPFVRAVLVSGSLSKGYMDENSDLDFFVITHPKRLWIARGLLALYKRIFLGNSHKYFCTNYFLDGDHLEIEEKNLFTATELATLIPICGEGYHHLMMEKNMSWLTKIFPNYKLPHYPIGFQATPITKRVAERVINICFGEVFDRLLMKLAERRWRRQYGRAFSKSEFAIAFKTNRHTSKNHPRNFQKSVMESYHELEGIYLHKLSNE